MTLMANDDLWLHAMASSQRGLSWVPWNSLHGVTMRSFLGTLHGIVRSIGDMVRTTEFGLDVWSD